SMSQGRFREEPQFGQGIEYNPARVKALDLIRQDFSGAVQLQLGWLVKGGLGYVLELLLDRGQFENLELIQGPPVRLRDPAQFLLGFRKSDIQAGLTRFGSLSQELQRQRCLADTWVAFDEVHAVGWEPATQNVVHSCHASGAKFDSIAGSAL